MTYKCYKCKRIKDLNEFYKKASKKNGYSGRCKKCDNIMKTNWKSKNPEKVTAYEKKRWKSRGKDNKKRKADNIRSQKNRVEMSDSYMRELITKKSKTLESKDVPDEFIEIYRLSLKLKRALGLTPKLKPPT